MNKDEIKPSQAFLFLSITILILFLLGSLISFSFNYSNWNLISKILFCGPSIILTVWTVNDYLFKQN